ncbi:hypothetical protein [Piscinibacter koreensis]|uniref:Uncharacterized protein n=1 Tax=Piscinibacter koreensis TaxID=2742824 RepID=A0A7Y6TVW1_9BURK|nr:hypothetical protein [Schlegelella koreensis]NUZ05372.1 hypothetical protein [Schlegelella koreensis]
MPIQQPRTLVTPNTALRAAMGAIALVALSSAYADPNAPVSNAASAVTGPEAPRAASAAGPAPAATGAAASVERMPQVVACKPRSKPMLMGSGPGQETYSVICANGYGLLVQCLSGECKVMN